MRIKISAFSEIGLGSKPFEKNSKLTIQKGVLDLNKSLSDVQTERFADIIKHGNNFDD